MRSSLLLRYALIVGAVLIFIFALTLLVQHTRALSFGDVVDAFAQVPPVRLWECVLLTAVSFLALGLYDVLAIHIVAPGRVSPIRALLTGAAANAVSNTLGFHAVTGTTVRYRLYRVAGLELADIARIVSVSWIALAFGFATLISFALLLHHGASDAQIFSGSGLILLLAVFAWWLAEGRTLSIAGISLPLPARSVAIIQMFVGAVEMAAAIGALYLLMPFDMPLSFADFAVLYIGAVLLGIASHAPGGIGVFEATILSLSGSHDKAGVLAALLLYRCLYNFLPFAIAASALGMRELVINWITGKSVSGAPDGNKA